MTKPCRIRLTSQDGSIAYVTERGETWIGSKEDAQRILQGFATSLGEIATIV